jgi:hypothetical protein
VDSIVCECHIRGQVLEVVDEIDSVDNAKTALVGLRLKIKLVVLDDFRAHREREEEAREKEYFCRQH